MKCRANGVARRCGSPAGPGLLLPLLQVAAPLQHNVSSEDAAVRHGTCTATQMQTAASRTAAETEHATPNLATCWACAGGQSNQQVRYSPTDQAAVSRLPRVCAQVKEAHADGMAVYSPGSLPAGGGAAGAEPLVCLVIRSISCVTKGSRRLRGLMRRNSSSCPICTHAAAVVRAAAVKAGLCEQSS